MICCIDFETTGTDFFLDEPIELGAVLMDEEFNIIKEFHSYIKPDRIRESYKDAFKIHGIEPRFLQNKPSAEEVVKSFFETLGTNYRLAGWNISFDAFFLRKIANKASMMESYNKINYRLLDVQSVSYMFSYMKKGRFIDFSLDDISQYFGFKRRAQHSALEDAQLTSRIFKSIVNEYNSLESLNL